MDKPHITLSFGISLHGKWNIKSTSPVFEGTNGTTWKVVGLCLKFLPRLHMEWEMVQRVMPRIRYVEVSHCYMLKSFPGNIDKLGVWRK